MATPLPMFTAVTVMSFTAPGTMPALSESIAERALADRVDRACRRRQYVAAGKHAATIVAPQPASSRGRSV